MSGSTPCWSKKQTCINVHITVSVEKHRYYRSIIVEHYSGVFSVELPPEMIFNSLS